jgi:aspartyl-tRNA(Asn)/glutamyl-tRNA(Gln) amidotransferase subunit A
VTDVVWLGAAELVRLYRGGELSPVEVAQVHLRRLEQLEPVLNAFMAVDAEGALRQADESAGRWRRGEPAGPLDGVPVTVKDLVAMRGWPTRLGSATSDPEAVAHEDAPAVGRLRESGAVILGKTTTPEFGWKGITDGPLFGITRNPWNPAHTPGGSSGGAAASLAAGIGAVAFGTDGGGSLRIPGSYSGLVGFKPSFGRVPDHPQEGLWCTLVAGGPLARSVADAALFLSVIARPDPRDWYALPFDGRDWRIGPGDGVRGLRIGYTDTLGHARVEGEVAAVVRAAAGLLEELGARVEPVGPLIEALRPQFEHHWKAGFAARLRGVAADRHHQLDPGFHALATEGLDVDLATVNVAQSARARLGAQLNAFHERYDLLLTPTMPSVAPLAEVVYHSPGFDRWARFVPFTLPFNLTGQPAASVPVGVSREGLPIGAQVVAARHREDLVLRGARALEAAVDLRHPHPRLLNTLRELGA